MLLICLPLLALCLYGIRLTRSGEDVLARSRTNAINGIFIILVFAHHLYVYVDAAGASVWGDGAYDWFNTFLDQLIVVPFLFFSGYGVSESIAKKGRGYVKQMPRRRLLTVLLNFDVAVLCYAIMRIVMGGWGAVGLKKFALSLLAWDSLGNDIWYIFCILFCYLFSYIAAMLFKSKRGQWLTILALSLVYVFVLSRVKQSWWYDTVFAYPAGCAMSFYKERLWALFRTKYALCLVVGIVAFLAFYYSPRDVLKLVANAKAVMFAFVVVLLMMKIFVGNSVLEWLGRNLFPIYIYQRLPMIVLSKVGGEAFVRDHEILYIVLCLIITLLIAYVYDRLRLSIRLK